MEENHWEYEKCLREECDICLANMYELPWEQELESSEFITVIKVPLNAFRESLESLNSSGYKIFAGLYMFALGLEMNEND